MTPLIQVDLPRKLCPLNSVVLGAPGKRAGFERGFRFERSIERERACRFAPIPGFTARGSICWWAAELGRRHCC